MHHENVSYLSFVLTIIMVIIYTPLCPISLTDGSASSYSTHEVIQTIIIEVVLFQCVILSTLASP